MTTIAPVSFPYVSLFDAYTVSTTVPQVPTLIENVTLGPNRSLISYNTLSRIREFDAGNNRLLNVLRPIDDTEDTLITLRKDVVDLQKLADAALSLKTSPPTTPTPPPPTPFTPPPIEARTTVSIDANTLVDGATAGMRLSISADNGEDFVFTFTGSATTWGEVAASLNAAEIGVRARFDASGPNGSRLVLESANGKTGFRINGTSSRQVVDDLVGISSPYDGGYAAAKFTDGAGSSAMGGLGPPGLTFGVGGSLVTAGAGSFAAGSVLRFIGSDGVPRQWGTSTGATVRQAMLDINAMRGSVVAEMTADGRLRLRDARGGDVGTGLAQGSFAASGSMALQRDVNAPPQPGLAADAIAARASTDLDRDSRVSGAANGMRLSITADNGANFTYTFGMDADTVTWGQVADALALADIGVRIRFDENQIGSPRLSIYSVDDRLGFRINGTSSRQVVDDLFGISSPYDGPFQPEMFANGAEWPAIGLAAKENGMVFGRGAAIKTLGPAQTISADTSITFVDGDGITRKWVASGTNTSPITMIEEIKGFRSNVIAEIAGDRSLRLRSLDGRSITIVEQTGDFDPEVGAMRFIENRPPPNVTPARSTFEQIISMGRVLNSRIAHTAGSLVNVAYKNNVAISEIMTTVNMLNAATPSDNWANSEDTIKATRDNIVSALGQVDQTLAQLTDRLSTLKAMEVTYLDIGNDLKNFAVEMLDSYLTWDEARDMAEGIRKKLTKATSTMGNEQAHDFLLLLG
ncbi:MAG: hypothetical protein IOC63_11710 [Methylobacterium sp.]|nr:hypothetical protein [Methylobacterium sp.]